MYVKQFPQKDNIQTVWEVISNSDAFRFLDRSKQSLVYDTFVNNIRGFYESERTGSNNLMDMNKKYIMLIMNYIASKTQTSKITIHPEASSMPLVTHEEIQQNRRTKFEQDLSRRQDEFAEMTTIKKPPVPNFADKNVDTPIKDLDAMLREIQTQRKYDVEHINANQIITGNDVNWLRSQETSSKPNYSNDMTKQNYYENPSNMTQKQPETETDRAIHSETSKTVRFSGEKSNIYYNHDNEKEYEDDDDLDVFSKLKPLKEPKEPESLERRITSIEKNIERILHLLQNNQLSLSSP